MLLIEGAAATATAPCPAPCALCSAAARDGGRDLKTRPTTRVSLIDEDVTPRAIALLAAISFCPGKLIDGGSARRFLILLT